MKKRTWLYLWLSMVVMLIAGCGKKIKANTEEEIVLSNGFICESNSGLLFDGNTDKAYFYDYQTKITLPLCSRPNCRHESEENCTAMLFDRLAYLPTIYNGSLYYVRLDENQGKWNYYKAEVTGENEKLVTYLNYDVVEPFDAVLYENTAYLIGNIYENVKNEIDSDLFQGSSSLFSINLETGEVKSLLEITYGPDGTAMIDLLHIYNGTLYIHIYAREADDTLKDGYYSLDLNTGEFYELDWGENICVSAWKDEKAVFYDRKSENEAEKKTYWYLNLDTDEKRELADTYYNGIGMILEEGFLYCEWESDYKEGMWYLYRWSSQKNEMISEVKKEELFIPELAVIVDGKEMIVGTYHGKNNHGNLVEGHFMIASEEFISGGTNYRYLCEINN